MSHAATPAASPRRLNPGRDLRAAIAVGAGMGGLVFATVFTVRVLWVLVVCLAIGVGTYELVQALRVAERRLPVVPMAAGAAAQPLVGYLAGGDGLVLVLMATVLVATAWRLLDPVGRLLPDLAAIGLTAVYVGFLGGFAGLLASGPDGPRRTCAFIGVTVASDIGGYTAGVLSGGRHKLAPHISPGKSWEGFAGSVVVCMALGALLIHETLHRSALLGIVYGAALACSATLGDLGESMIKRDIGVKDMGHLLPGHGGIMDRLDSLLIAAPVAWVLLTHWVHR